MNLKLKTPRLNIVKFEESDAEFIFEILNSAGWLQFIGDRNVKTLEEAKKYIIENFIKSYNENSYGFLKVIKKENNETIGVCGITKRNYLDKVDFGYAFLEKHQRNGFALEASEAILSELKNTHLGQVYAIINTDNLRSISLIEKLGFQLCENSKQKLENKFLFEINITNNFENN